MELQYLLYKLKESQLQGVFDFLSITCPEGKSRCGMLKLLINYLTNSTFEESGDGGMSEYLASKDYLHKVIKTKNKTVSRRAAKIKGSVSVKRVSITKIN